MIERASEDPYVFVTKTNNADNAMKFTLWTAWSEAFSELRPAFSRKLTFLWASIFCAGMAVRPDTRGVSSIVACFSLKTKAYKSLLGLCHSSAIDLDKLLAAWIRLCFKLFSPACLEGYMVLIADGIKVGKEGKKMPAVKSLHQDSQSNAKAKFIMGHYLQAVSLLVVSPFKRHLAVPLVAQIHDGIAQPKSSYKSCITKLADLILQIVAYAEIPTIVIADAYFSVKNLIEPLSMHGCRLISRVKHNVVAYTPVLPTHKKKRGRPRLKGDRVELSELFKDFNRISIPLGDKRYFSVDLYWPSAGGIVRFVLVSNSKGKAILMSTDTSIEPEQIIKLYESRWLIETGFKVSKHQLGMFFYHFWMKKMDKTKSGQLQQDLTNKSKKYRQKVEQKIRSYHIFLALGCISHGLLIYLSANYSKDVWGSFTGWLRTIRPDLEPSELVTANALRSTLPNFLVAENMDFEWKKLLLEKVDYTRSDVFRKTG